jgi:hypothetical protein
VLKNATRAHFAKLEESLLKAFIKARILTDAADQSLDDKMPKKANATVAKNKPPDETLIGWAYSL